MTTLQRIRGLKPISEFLATWVTIVGAFGAGLITLYEYHAKVIGDRVAETLRYEEKFESTPLLEIRQRLDSFWTDAFDGMTTAGKKGQHALSIFVTQSIDGDKRVQGDTLAILNFFDGLKACNCAGLCDLKLTMQLLGKDAFDFYGLNYPYIMSQRKKFGDSSYGLGLTAIATAYVTKKPGIVYECHEWP